MARDSIRATLRAAIAGATPRPEDRGGCREADLRRRRRRARLCAASWPTRAQRPMPLKGAAASEVAPASQPVSGALPRARGRAAASAVPDAAFAVPGPAPAGNGPTARHMRPRPVGPRRGRGRRQLAQGREPAFRLALDARAKAGAHSHGVGARYRRSSGIREQTLGMAQRALASDLGGCAVRGTRGALVGAHQLAAKAATPRASRLPPGSPRPDRTRADVDRILEPLEKRPAPASRPVSSGRRRPMRPPSPRLAAACGTWLSTWGRGLAQPSSGARVGPRRLHAACGQR